MKTLMITGGSSGIGFAISKIFAKNNYRLLWVAVDEKELENAKALLQKENQAVEIHTLTKDLTEKKAAAEVLEWAENIAEVDVLINNAGFGTYGYFEEMPLEKELSMIELNVMCVVKMTHLFLEKMQQRNRGTIINMSSSSSFQPVARMNTYASTKAFVTHFSRGLQEELELKKSKVKVITVCPAAVTDTNFKVSGKMEAVKTFDGSLATTTAEVAQDVWAGFSKGKTLIVSGARMRAMHRMRNLFPYRFQQYVVRKETELKK